ncbi:hypothetical protein FTX61_06540 [Nitriliruptoraceae bacterium ZYF776]|nr:hypothetical protein [Profundirhabdus halotolerans]
MRRPAPVTGRRLDAHVAGRSTHARRGPSRGPAGRGRGDAQLDVQEEHPRRTGRGVRGHGRPSAPVPGATPRSSRPRSRDPPSTEPNVRPACGDPTAAVTRPEEL